MMENNSSILAGEAKMGLARSEMSGLLKIIDIYNSGKPLKGCRIAGCMCVTVETAILIETLIKLGAEVRWCSSNPKASDDDIIAALRDKGIDVFARGVEDLNEFQENKEKTLFKDEEFWPNLVIDDGCALIDLLHEKYSHYCKDIIGASEETTSGVQRARVIDQEGGLKFSVMATNNSVTKSRFDNFYGCAESFVDGLKQSINILLAGKKSVVVGYGQVGKGVAKILKNLGSEVTVTEVDPICALQAHLDGYEVAKLEDIAPYKDLFITATGNIKVIPQEQVKRMKNGAILCNMGHDNTEVEMPSDLPTTSVKSEIKKYYISKDKFVYLLGDGYIVNLACASGNSSFIMSCSFANQIFSTIYLWENNKKLPKKVLNLPRKLDELVAEIHLSVCDIEIDKLTHEQRRYQGIFPGDPFKAENYYY